MARRYDSRTTIFSPEGRLFQVEYAMEAISQSGLAVGVLTKDGVVLAAEKRMSSKLLDTGKTPEKMYKIDDHVACAVAGITSDANILVNYCRLASQRYLFQYDEPVPLENLLMTVCDTKQGYTQYGGQRPFGVSFLFAGWDKHFGFQLYQSDPSGNYGGWKAQAIGNNNRAAQSILKSDYSEDMTLEAAKTLVVKVMSKSLDSTTLSAEKLEFATVTRSPEGEVVYEVTEAAEIDKLIAETDLTADDDA